MKNIMKILQINNNNFPSVGYGTWKLKDNDETSQIIKSAIECGYRLIDTASAYQNERAIGKGIKMSNVSRDELVISGKLWNDDRGYENIIKACKRTIKNLNCGYLDLYLIHWPASMELYDNWKEINAETWKALEFLKESGLVREIGVCNFKKHHLEALKETLKIKPLVNQIEVHPGQYPKELIEYCQNEGIIVEAWSPLGSGKLMKKQEMIDISKKYGASVAQVCLAWSNYHNLIPLPRSTNNDRMKANLNISSIKLSLEDIAKLDSIEKMAYSGLDPDTITIFK